MDLRATQICSVFQYRSGCLLQHACKGNFPRGVSAKQEDQVCKSRQHLFNLFLDLSVAVPLLGTHPGKQANLSIYGVDFSADMNVL